MSRSDVFARIAATLFLTLNAGPVLAFCTTLIGQRDSHVVETYDAGTDRFFLSWDAHTAIQPCGGLPSYIEKAPPGTVDTGLSFSTWSLAALCATSVAFRGVDCRYARDVCRFRAAGQEPPSRFFTINAAECEALKRPDSGWTFEPSPGTGPAGAHAPLSGSDIDPATGNCPAGLVPVYRFYNNRWREGLSNHRFVADEGVRREMQGRPGWSDEGVVFCVPGANRGAIARVEGYLSVVNMAFQSGACPGGAMGGACIEGENMAVPFARRGPFLIDGTKPVQPLDYYDRTGAITRNVFAYPASTDEAAAARSFLQLEGSARGGGIFISSVDRAAAGPSGLRIRKFPSLPPMRPFLPVYDVDMDFAVVFEVYVKRVRTGGAQTGAGVHPSVTLRDSISGRRVILLPGAIGTGPFANEVTGAAEAGEVHVAIALGSSPAFGRSYGLASLVVPGQFDSVNGWGFGGRFDYRINRAEFRRVLGRAQEFDPRLSGDPGDYTVESTTMKGEIAGEAQLGFNIQLFVVEVIRP